MSRIFALEPAKFGLAKQRARYNDAEPKRPD